MSNQIANYFGIAPRGVLMAADKLRLSRPRGPLTALHTPFRLGDRRLGEGVPRAKIMD
jgi:hypothetical protein